MAKRRPEIPEYKVYKKAERPYMIGQLGGTGIAQLVAVEPAAMLPEGYIATATMQGSTLIRPMHMIGDKALLFEVSAAGQGPEAEENLNKTIEAIDICLNAWHRPDDYLQLLYSSRPQQTGEAGRPTARSIPDLPL